MKLTVIPDSGMTVYNPFHKLVSSSHEGHVNSSKEKSRKDFKTSLPRALQIIELTEASISKAWVRPTSWFSNAVVMSKPARLVVINRMAAAIVKQHGSNISSFRFAFAGISNTAGHDNYFNESFPNTLDRLLRPAFEAAGVNLRVDNFAIGGCPPFPYAFCLQNIFGESTGDLPPPDIVSWEHSQMVSGFNRIARESYIRRVLLLPSQPIPLIMALWSGIREPNMKYGTVLKPLDKKTEPLPTNSHMEPQFRDAYEKFGLHFFGPLYSMWKDDHEAPFTYNLLWKKRPSGLFGAKHHPGTGAHQLYGSFLAIAYLDCLKQAILNIMKQKSHRSIEPLPLPNPVFIRPSRFWVPDKKNGQCATTVEPRIGPSLQTIVENKDFQLKWAGRNNWPLRFTNNGSWMPTLHCGDRGALPRQLKLLKASPPIDRKWVISGGVSGSWLRFRLDNMKHGLAAICSWGGGKNDKQCAFSMCQASKLGVLQIEVNGTIMAYSACGAIADPKWKTVPEKDLKFESLFMKKIAPHCALVSSLKEGNNILGVRLKPGSPEHFRLEIFTLAWW
eukprot:UC4_evm3s1178